MAVQQLRQQEFEKNTKDIIIIKFTGDWCYPCKVLAPIYKELSEEINKDFYEVDIDKEPKLVQRFNIMSVPTIIIFKNGKEVFRINGFMPKHQLKEKILSEIK